MMPPKTDGAKQFAAIAEFYEQHAETFPEGSYGRMANLSEAADYRRLSLAANYWPQAA